MHLAKTVSEDILFSTSILKCDKTFVRQCDGDDVNHSEKLAN
jgi:hypothetical protein